MVENNEIMAESLAHRWGQIIGDCFEFFVRKLLEDVADRHGLYLDYKQPRGARGGQSKVTWQDAFGNKHDLDYVLERKGAETSFGLPVAFIESAWRRYTKHSKNKVQEIEAAVLPVALAFSRHQPFCGAVLGGEFTETAIRQLESKGFGVLHIPYGSIVSAFSGLGIDASSKDGVRGTTEKEFRRKIAKWESLPDRKRMNAVLRKLTGLHKSEIAHFKERLEEALTRRVLSVRLTVLRGYAIECPDIESAIRHLIQERTTSRLRHSGEAREAFEVQVRFNTGSKIDATFSGKDEAVSFLRSFA